MRNVLITGFGPFGGDPINPALEAIKRMEGRTIANHRIFTRELPVTRFESCSAIEKHIHETDPVLVLAIGQAGGRLEITPERVAINVDDFRIPDNGGFQPIDEPVAEGAPLAYLSTLPIKAMVAAMRQQGIPAAVSSSAGTFVCNHLFYGLMHFLAESGSAARGGFVHIPYLPEQAARLGAQPSMAVDTIVRGLEISIAAALSTPVDIRQSGGTIS
ncbi:pyroglutamyl-peptidase I [Pseudomonas sp. MBLB4136]|uniref:pyroglutamyl-peptidase I n=1 Tax=Pseudomonas sp. MBLB4136 TaxID=3451558 RepID=UPI003F7522B6